MASPGDVDDRLAKLAARDDVSPRNKELVEKFISYLRAEGNVSAQRQLKYLGQFGRLFSDYIDFDLDNASKDQVREVVGNLRASDYSDWTKADYVVLLRRFFGTLWEDARDRPRNVKRILNSEFLKKRSNQRIERKKTIEALTPEEVMELTTPATNPRDRLLPLFLFETGARISEVLDIQLKDVEMKQKYAEVTVPTRKNDKGPRTLQLTRSVGLLQDWLNAHPATDDEEAYLFVNVSARGGNAGRRGKQMTNRNVNKILSRLADRAGIEKRVTSHVFRHSAATHYGQDWGPARLKYWFGWTTLATAREYIHENAERMRAARLKEEGLADEETGGGNATDRKECGRCGSTWPPTAKYCGDCSLALDKDAAEKAEQLADAGQQLLEHLMDSDETVEDLIRRID